VSQALLNGITGIGQEERLQNKKQHWKITCVASKNTIRKAVFRCDEIGMDIDSVIVGGLFPPFWD